MKKIVLPILFFNCALSFGQHKIIETTADIKSVTIYNSSAEINYQKDVLLPEGKSTVVFTSLTPFIVENTINLTASDPGLDIITITEKINFTKERNDQNSRIKELRDSLKYFESELGMLEVREDALSTEKKLLFNGESIGGVAKGVAVAEIEKASAFFSKRYYELTKDLFVLSEKKDKLNQTTNKFRNQIAQLTTNAPESGSEIYVTIINPVRKSVTFSFKFLTDKAGWAPVYDCKYQGAQEPLKFIFRANVFNATGIAWDNVNVTLSTANPTKGFDTPSLNAKNDTKSADLKRQGNVQFREIEVINAIAEYPIKHKYSVPSDSKPYLVDVDAYDIKATYNYLLIPKLDPFGFLMARIPDWNKYNLIPGVTNVYNKGSFMGKTFLNTYAANDTLSLFLGKDKNIQSTRKEITRDNSNSFIGNYYVEKTEVSMSVKNNTGELMIVQVLDQVPETDDEDKIKLNLQNVDQAIYNKKEGLLTWNYKMNAGETKSIDFKYELKSPKNLKGRGMLRKFRTISCPAF